MGGVDLSYHNEDDEISKTSGFERASFKPIPVQENGDQVLQGLNYKITNWRHGEEAMDPFHDEVGYLLWEKATGQVMQCVVFGRGISILAGADANPRDKKIHFNAEPGDPYYGILQNKFLLERAELTSYDHIFTFNDDGTFSHSSDIVLRHAVAGKSYHHTDESTLHRVKRYHPSVEIG